MTTDDITFLISQDRLTASACIPSHSRLSVTNVRFHPDMSDETMCFSADILIDGRKCGTCRNTGQGGCTDYYASSSKTAHAFVDIERTLRDYTFSDAPSIRYSLDELLYDLVLTQITSLNPSQEVW